MGIRSHFTRRFEFTSTESTILVKHVLKSRICTGLSVISSMDFDFVFKNLDHFNIVLRIYIYCIDNIVWAFHIFIGIILVLWHEIIFNKTICLWLAFVWWFRLILCWVAIGRLLHHKVSEMVWLLSCCYLFLITWCKCFCFYIKLSFFWVRININMNRQIWYWLSSLIG